MRLRKVASILMIGLLLLTGCNTKSSDVNSSESKSVSGSNGAEEKVTINLWHLWTTDTDSMRIGLENAVKAYMLEHPNVDIKINMLENEAYKTKILTEFSGKAAGIDMFFYFGGGRGQQLANAGKLLNIDEYLTAEDKALMHEGSTDYFTYDDNLYALPIYSKFTLLYANQELFDQVGAKIPTNYDELVKATELFVKAGITPITQGVKDGWQAGYIVDGLSLRTVGASDVNKTLQGEIPYDDEGYLEAAQKTIDLVNLGAFGKDPLEVGNADADNLFIRGKAAMRITGNWLTDTIYTSRDSVVQDKIVALPIPMVTGGNGLDSDYYGGYVDTFFINKNVANPEEVVKLDVYLTKELAKIRHETGQGISAWDVDIDDSKLNPLAKQILEFSKTNITGVLSWDNVLDNNTSTIHYEAAQELFTPGASAEDYFKANQEAFKK